MRRSTKLTVVAAALFAIGAGVAVAQFGPGPGGRAPYSAQPGPRNEAGRFDYYAMVLSWSPTFCAGQNRGNNDLQCGARAARPYAFVTHGLWPQHERGWPENCQTRERPFVPQQIINKMLDIMPAPNLVIHEYRKHGTCSGLSPESYFDLTRKLYNKVKIPPRYERLNAPITVSPAEIVSDFVSVNPQMKPDSIAVTCNGPGNRLREIRVCFTREGEYRACGRNEDARRLCGAPKVYIPPVRASAQPSDQRRGDGVPPQSIPPGPGEPSLNNSRGERRI